MARVPIFYSFHFDNDVFRVQQVRNMGIVDGDEPVSPNEWEQIKRKGDASIRKWIDDNMKHRRCVIVLVGEQTAKRPWVKYEIEKAWNDHRGLFGIYVHNLKDPRTGTCSQGPNPFSSIKMDNGRPMSDYVTCRDPSWFDTYNSIKANMQGWVDAAIAEAKVRWG
jgi:hypothetical protein